MKILHLVLRPRFSGAEMVVRDLSVAHLEQGHEVAVASLQTSEPAFEGELEALAAKGAELHVPERDLSRWARIRQVQRAVRAFQPDLIVAHSALPAVYARLAKVLTPWRFSQTTLAIALHAEDDFKIRSLRWAECLLTHVTDRVVAVCETGKANYEKRVRHHPDIRVISNGIDHRRFQQASHRRQALRDRCRLSPNDRVILHVGRLSKEKGQSQSLNALRPLLEENPNAQIWFAGLTEMPNYALQLQWDAAGSEAAERIRFLGSRRDVAELMAVADLLVMPSTEEAQGVAVIEALASGLPIIANDLPTLRYAEDHQGVCLLDASNPVTFKEKASQWLDDQARHPGRELERHDITRCERHYRALFEENPPHTATMLEALGS